MNEPAVTIKNILFQNWSLTTPARDATPETFDPTKVHLTTRYWATNPQRIHSFQVSVIAGPARKEPVEIGALTMYKVEEEINIHVWAVAGIGKDWETTEQSLRNMLDQIDLTVRLSATTAAGIQFLRLTPGWQMLDERENRLVLHRVTRITAIYYRTETVLPPLPVFPQWDTAPWLWDTSPALWS